MAIALDAVSTASGSGVGPFTWAHTCAGADRMLMVSVSHYNPSATVTGITYNSIALTVVPSANVSNGDYHTTLWGLIAPATGSNTVSVSVSGNVYDIGVAAISLTGVHQTAPYGTAGTASGSGTTPTVAVLADVADWVLDSLVIVSSGTLSVGGGQTSRWNAATSNAFIKYAGSTESGAGGSTTANWTNTSSQVWAMVAVPIKPVAAVGSSTMPVIVHHLRQQGIA